MSAMRYYLVLDLEEGSDSICWVQGIRGLNTGDTDRWAHGQAMLAHRRLYMQHDSAGSWAGPAVAEIPFRPGKRLQACKGFTNM